MNTHRIMRCFLPSLLFIFSWLFASNLYGNDLTCDWYKEQANIYLNTAIESSYLQLGRTLSQEKNDIESELYFLHHLTRNAYNRWETDSVSFWAKQGIALANSHQQYKSLVNILSLDCLKDLFLDNFESASQKAEAMCQIGKEHDLPNGIIASYEAMGILYRQTSRPKQALDSYIDGLEYVRKTHSIPSQEMQFLAYIIEMYLTQEDTDKALLYIQSYADMIAGYEEGRYSNRSPIPVSRCKKLVHCFYTDLYIQTKDYKKAREHYFTSTQFVDVDDVYVNYYYGMNTISYHQYVTKRYDLALKGIDEMIKEEMRPEILQRKAEILVDMQEYNSAAQTFQDLIVLKDSINDYELHKQLNHMRSQLDVATLERDKKEMEADQAALHFRLVLLSFAIVVVILFFVVIWLIRMARVKNILKISANELRVAKERAEESSRLKTIFIQNMSHEIRTPLNAIVGFSSLLTEMPDQAEEFAPIIEENTNLLLHLVDDLLNISAIESKNHTSLHYDQIDVRAVCQNAYDSVSTLCKPDVPIRILGPKGSLKIISDPLRIQQVLVNLLTNAIKYTNEGRIELHYGLVDKDSIRFEIKDTGIGVPVDKQEDIFMRFVKLDDFKQGTGLGLYICKTIVDAMKGKIYMDPTYTKGASFVVTLPTSSPQTK